MKALERTRPDIGIVVAMEPEADPIARGLGLSRRKGDGPNVIYQNPDGSVVMITPRTDPRFQSLNMGTPISQLGKVAATLATSELITFNPKAIINCGTAGGMDSTTIGDIIVGTGVTQHDIAISEFPGYNEWSKRTIPLDAARIPVVVLKAPLVTDKIKQGIVSTGESFTLDFAQDARLIESGALAKDMEAFAVVETAELLRFAGVVLVIKTITDFVHGGEPEEFNRNFNLAMQSLTTFMQILVSNRQEFLSET